MVGLEKDILYLVSRVRCVTENQVGKVFNSKKRNGKKSLKRTLRKMCNDYTLRKLPCNINYTNFKDNSGVYYLNGSNIEKGKSLTKMLLGSEIAIRLNSAGYETVRFYRNAKVGDETYDIFIEYINPCGERLQVLIDIELDESFRCSKYSNIYNDIDNSTIPFFMVPKVIVISSREQKHNKCNINEHIYFLDTSLNKLFNYL
ncbi:hypothetical protein [Terrisporobacter petrolearius]|uniref:hypothetical protein n=1 Tax=Terrisporobacter petrolearius TaxID=1460447 RepID=UPI0031CC657B